MRLLLFFTLMACLAGVASAAAPPAKVPREWSSLIDDLGDDDEDVRKAAQKKLTRIGEDVLPLLKKAGKSHADPDVRLHATVLAIELEKKLYGEVRRFTGSEEGVAAFALSPDGTKMVSGCWAAEKETVARVWDVRTGKELMQLKGHTSSVSCLDWSRDGKRILSGGVDKSIRLWDAADGKLLKTIDDAHTRWLHAVLFAPDGKTALSCGNDRSIVVWDLATGKEKKRIDVHAAPVRGLAWLPGTRRVASASFDGTVRIIDVETGKEVSRMGRGHAPRPAWFVAVSPDGKRIASTGADNVVRLWDVQTGKQLQVYSGHTQGVHGIAYSRDGKRLLSCAESARLWDVETGEEMQRMVVPGRVTCVAFADDGHAVFSCYDKTLRLWKIRK
jgi:WD40 repeat protein